MKTCVIAASQLSTIDMNLWNVVCFFVTSNKVNK